MAAAVKMRPSEEGLSLRWEEGLTTLKRLVPVCISTVFGTAWISGYCVPSQDVRAALRSPSLGPGVGSLYQVLRSLLSSTFPNTAGGTPLALGSVIPRVPRRVRVAAILAHDYGDCK